MHVKNNKHAHLRAGFTFLELAVIIVIIGLLAVISYVSLGQVRMKGRDARRVSDIQNIQQALSMYKSDQGYYPDESEFQPGQPLVGQGDETYMAKIPSNPQPADGDCNADEYTYHLMDGGNSFFIEWCLGTELRTNVGPDDCHAVPTHICSSRRCGDCVYRAADQFESSEGFWYLDARELWVGNKFVYVLLEQGDGLDTFEIVPQSSIEHRQHLDYNYEVIDISGDDNFIYLVSRGLLMGGDPHSEDDGIRVYKTNSSGQLTEVDFYSHDADLLPDINEGDVNDTFSADLTGTCSSGDYLYGVGTGGGTLVSLDINKSTGELTYIDHHFSTKTQYWYNCKIYGDYLYTYGGYSSNGLFKIDSDGSIEYLGEVMGSDVVKQGGRKGLDISEGYLYMAVSGQTGPSGYPGGTHVFDLADPENPQYLTTIRQEGQDANNQYNHTAVMVDGDYVFTQVNYPTLGVKIWKRVADWKDNGYAFEDVTANAIAGVELNQNVIPAENYSEQDQIFWVDFNYFYFLDINYALRIYAKDYSP